MATAALSLLVLGCQQKTTLAPTLVENATPIVGADQKTTEALGIETSGGVFTPLINAGTTVPCEITETFTTSDEGQTQIVITILRSANPTTASNTALGEFQIIGIPAGPPGSTVVEVTFRISTRQILLLARDRDRRTDLEIRRVAAKQAVGGKESRRLDSDSESHIDQKKAGPGPSLRD